MINYKENLKEYRRIKSKEYREKHPIQNKRRKKLYYESHKKERSEYVKKYYKKLKLSCIDHYSNGSMQCACCGENHMDFLTMDHVNGGGMKHRREVAAGKYIYRWIVKNNFPNLFQVLCFNCNCGRSVNHGVCPHKSEQNQQLVTSGKETYANDH